MIKMAAMAINRNNLLKSSLLEPELEKAYDFETWHEALGNRGVQS